MAGQQFDVLIMTTAEDFRRLREAHPMLWRHLDCRRILFVGSCEVEREISALDYPGKVGFLNEEDILPFKALADAMSGRMADILRGRPIPRGIVGWYYQQFLKMQYAMLCEDEYYMTWDGDTVPCRDIFMFDEKTGAPFFDMKGEYFKEYFDTMGKLLPGLGKASERSFISEHMLFDCRIMREMISDIEKNENIPGESFWEKIVNAIEPAELQENRFSEFETYGNYTTLRHPGKYMPRSWRSFRRCGMFFAPGDVREEDYRWFGKDFHALSFEKMDKVDRLTENIFQNPKYRARLSARRMVEIIQEGFEFYHQESWDDSMKQPGQDGTGKGGTEATAGDVEAYEASQNGRQEGGSDEAARDGAGNSELYTMTWNGAENLEPDEMNQNGRQARELKSNTIVRDGGAENMPGSASANRGAEFRNEGTGLGLPAFGQDEWREYERLGDARLSENPDQAFLCYENAEFLCGEPLEKERLREKKAALFDSGRTGVRHVTIIIISFNERYIVQKCIESLRAYCSPDACGILVLDNASEDGTAEWLREQGDVGLLLSDENMGYVRGCNEALSLVPPEDDVLLLHQDMRMAPNALFWLRMGLYGDRGAGAAGCVSNYGPLDQLAGPFFRLPAEYLAYGKERNVLSEGALEEKAKLSGFALLLRREALDKAGCRLDESFSPGYLEDDDLCMRIRAAGYRLLCCRNSFVYHAGLGGYLSADNAGALEKKNSETFLRKWGCYIRSMTEGELRVPGKIRRERHESFRLLHLDAGSGALLERIKCLYPNALLIGTEAEHLASGAGTCSVPILCLDWKTQPLPFPEGYFDYIVISGSGADAVTGSSATSVIGAGSIAVTGFSETSTGAGSDAITNPGADADIRPGVDALSTEPIQNSFGNEHEGQSVHAPFVSISGHKWDVNACGIKSKYATIPGKYLRSGGELLKL